ncbi:nucleoside triphosphate pyrophosphohydrolase [Methylonatrum kenyense]|uniref:nucleoside triphosphate pyrophosphohydrolase n=1 Tax=Methylonatrum kenyense TaxID=455253 RepID=UPI0020C164B4|nr:nucleoside triphosphate pyrophosphohydrolase [Methylonatrum kenyense]MCK8516440.1 nucleoside triphosphate pyrophosphohydrolase [Methylonatrum kenyense]
MDDVMAQDDLLAMRELLHIMRRLRDPQFGCPWDVQQTFRSIAPYTLEEAYEVADAIERDDLVALRDELGDLLLQVVFHARMAEEAGHFDFAEVAAGIADKMLRRHPHVFGDEQVRSAEDQTRRWEAIKAEERAASGASQDDDSALAGVSLAMPGLLRAVKLTRRAARVAFDWPDADGVFDKVAEELDELRAEHRQHGGHERLEDELGDLLFATANLARHLELDPEAALRRANRKFERRFRHMERHLAGRGERLDTVDFEERERAWNRAKQHERQEQ